jgi:hypothetical protein
MLSVFSLFRVLVLSVPVSLYKRKIDYSSIISNNLHTGVIT